MHHRILSFKYAFQGLNFALKKEPNLKFHFFVGLMVIFSGVFLRISRTDWILVIILIGLVISVELTNTSVEKVVDAFTDKSHPGAKLAKDISAGAVLTVALVSAVAGLIIFLPYI